MGEMVSEIGNDCVIAVKEDGGIYNGVALRGGEELARGCDADLDSLTQYLENEALYA